MIEAAKSTTSKRKRFFTRVFLILVGGLLAFAWFFRYTSPPAHAHRSFRQIQTAVDPEALRRWAAEQAASHPRGSYLSKEEILESLVKLEGYPPRVSICASNEPFVTVWWGGGFFHWGMLIGATNFLLEPSPGLFHDMEWVAGIYFRHQGECKP